MSRPGGTTGSAQCDTGPARWHPRVGPVAHTGPAGRVSHRAGPVSHVLSGLDWFWFGEWVNLLVLDWYATLMDLRRSCDRKLPFITTQGNQINRKTYPLLMWHRAGSMWHRVGSQKLGLHTVRLERLVVHSRMLDALEHWVSNLMSGYVLSPGHATFWSQISMSNRFLYDYLSISNLTN